MVALLIAGAVLIAIHGLLPDKPIALAMVVFVALWMAFTFAVVLTIGSLFMGYVPGWTVLGQRGRKS